MKKILRILLGGAVLSYALSTIAMQEFPSDEGGFSGTKKVEKQPLKFKITGMEKQVADYWLLKKIFPLNTVLSYYQSNNSETSTIEDAEGSSLIYQYRCVVMDLCEGYGGLRDTAQKELDDLETALNKMPENSDEYFATVIYKNQLVSRFFKFKKKVSDIIDQELFLQKFLKEIYKSSPSSDSSAQSSYMRPMVIPNYEVLSSYKFTDIGDYFLFSISDCPSEGNESLKDLREKYCIQLEIKRNFSSPDIMNEFHQRLNSNNQYWKLGKTQKEIYKISKLICHLLKGTEHKLNSKDQSYLGAVQEMAEVNEKTTIGLLKEQIENLMAKAEDIYIPKLAPEYMFAKTIKAFCEEVDRHRAMLPNK